MITLIKAINDYLFNDGYKTTIHTLLYDLPCGLGVLSILAILIVWGLISYYERRNKNV